ncbi:SDR family oxidoreductase [Denitratisoma sp. agr-D3]
MKKIFSTKAVVSGHSRGLGAAVAAELLSSGIPVLGLARAGNAALAKAHPDLLTEVALDLADSAAVARWLASDGLTRFIVGAETVLLVNNAGTVQPMAPLAEQDPALIARAVALNVAAPLQLAAALAAVGGAAACRILHVSSGAGRNAYPGWSVYGATKAALDHHARAVALEGKEGLRVCSLAPGVVDTEMQGEIRATPEALFPLKDRFLALKQEGQLTSPTAAAKRLVAYLRSAAFGEAPVADLRELPDAP